MLPEPWTAEEARKAARLVACRCFDRFEAKRAFENEDGSPLFNPEAAGFQEDFSRCYDLGMEALAYVGYTITERIQRNATPDEIEGAILWLRELHHAA